jgi:hypothetical protein
VAAVSIGFVTGIAPGTVTITATSEGKSGTATVTVTASNPPPPAGATEPVFNPAGNRSLFYDDFEAYNTTTDLWSGPNAKYWYNVGNVNLVNQAGYDYAGGAKFVRFDYSAAGSYANDIFTTQHHSPLLDTASVVILTYGFRDIGTFYTEKEMIIRDNNGSNRLVLLGDAWYITPQSLQNCWYASTSPLSPLSPSTPPLATGPSWSRDGLTPVGGPSPHTLGGNMGYPNVQFMQAGTQVGPKNDGRWHRFTYRFTKERAWGGTGRLEGWFDGVKFMEFIGDDPGRCDYGQVWTWGATNTVWTGDLYFIGTTSGGNGWAGGAVLDMDGVRLWLP